MKFAFYPEPPKKRLSFPFSWMNLWSFSSAQDKSQHCYTILLPTNQLSIKTSFKLWPKSFYNFYQFTKLMTSWSNSFSSPCNLEEPLGYNRTLAFLFNWMHFRWARKEQTSIWTNQLLTPAPNPLSKWYAGGLPSKQTV